MAEQQFVEVDLGFTNLEIGDHYVIARTAEAADIGVAEHNLVMEAVGRHTEFPVAFILDEVNSYSVKLETMMALRKESRISDFAVISYRTVNRLAHTFGAKLVRRPLAFLGTREEAREWVRSLKAKAEIA